MDWHLFLRLCFRELSPQPLDDPFSESSERLVGRDVGPRRSAFQPLPVLEVKHAVSNLGGGKSICNTFSQQPLEIP